MAATSTAELKKEVESLRDQHARQVKELETDLKSTKALVGELTYKARPVQEVMDEVNAFRTRRRKARAGGRQFHFKMKHKDNMRADGVDVWSSHADPKKALAELDRGFRADGEENRRFIGLPGEDPMVLVPVIDGVPADADTS